MKTTGKSIKELENEIIALREAQFRLKMQKSTGQLKQTHLLAENRKKIAQVKTEIRNVCG